MSESYTIHVRPLRTAQASDFVHDVEMAIGAALAPDPASGGLIASTAANVVYAFVADVDFDDDDEVPFSRYPWYIEQVPATSDTARERTLTHMRMIYQALVDTGRYGCCLVYALSQLVASNDGLTPEPSSSSR